MTARITNQWISKKAENTAELVDVISKADAFCQYCKPTSPYTAYKDAKSGEPKTNS